MTLSFGEQNRYLKQNVILAFVHHRVGPYDNAKVLAAGTWSTLLLLTKSAEMVTAAIAV